MITNSGIFEFFGEFVEFFLKFLGLFFEFLGEFLAINLGFLEIYVENFTYSLRHFTLTQNRGATIALNSHFYKFTFKKLRAK